LDRAASDLGLSGRVRWCDGECHNQSEQGPHHPHQAVAGAEIRASREVLDLVRDKLDLSLQAIRLRDAGKSWQEVKEAIELSAERNECVGGVKV
jgi:hypothetical protein